MNVVCKRCGKEFSLMVPSDAIDMCLGCFIIDELHLPNEVFDDYKSGILDEKSLFDMYKAFVF